MRELPPSPSPHGGCAVTTADSDSSSEDSAVLQGDFIVCFIEGHFKLQSWPWATRGWWNAWERSSLNSQRSQRGGRHPGCRRSGTAACAGRTCPCPHPLLPAPTLHVYPAPCWPCWVSLLSPTVLSTWNPSLAGGDSPPQVLQTASFFPIQETLGDQSFANTVPSL